MASSPAGPTAHGPQHRSSLSHAAAKPERAKASNHTTIVPWLRRRHRAVAHQSPQQRSAFRGRQRWHSINTISARLGPQAGTPAPVLTGTRTRIDEKKRN